MVIDYKQAKAVFLEAVHHVPADGWDAYIQRACGDDADLRGHVLGLLQEHAAAGQLATHAIQSVAARVAPVIAEAPGTIIGPYKLLEQIGEGGMGLVFVAEQEKPVRRKVALKIIKPGMDTRQVIARFEAERQALAMMDHPHIAKVLDAGATQSGQPYFVMELVKGNSITEYCDQQRLPTRSRLELFLNVCQAVTHAHLKGIIHRDLKPSNVLVTVHDVTPVVKVIDFGIAKAAGQQLTDKTIYTGIAQQIGTPLYMSPEQAGLSGLDIDTRSDIYSLGVLLYELLTGNTPFESERFREAGYDEMRRIVREEDPPRPSMRLSTLAVGALSTIADRRAVEPQKLRRELRGELDWIAMKALEKDRNRRYESASALAADIQRYLDDQAVLAYPPTVTYRLLKVGRRHKAAVFTASVITFTILASSVFSALKYVDERTARREAVEHKKIVVIKAAEATTQRGIVNRQKYDAKRQRDAVRQNLYYADTRLALVDIESGNTSRARESLLTHLPDQGDADRRSWEWYYLLGQSHEAEQVLYGHEGEVITIAWSPDGNYIGSASFDGSACVWDAKTGKQLRRFDHGYTLKHGIQWSPDSRKLAWGSASGESALRIWDLDTDQVAVLHGHKGSVCAVAWSHDGKYVATGDMHLLDNPEPGNVRIWDVESLKSIAQYSSAPGANVLSVSWSADDHYLATAASGGKLFIWNTLSHDAIEHDIEEARWASWHPTEMQLAVATSDGSCLVWDYVSRETTLRWSAQRSALTGIQWSNDATRLLTSGEDGMVRLWDAKDGREQKSVAAHAGAANSVAWDVSGERFATAGTDGVIRVWATVNRPSPLVIETKLRGDLDLAWDNDGESVFLACREAEKIVAFSAGSGNMLEEIPFQLGENRRITSFRHIVERLAPTASGPVEVNISSVPVSGALSKVVSQAGFNCWHPLDAVLSPDHTLLTYLSQTSDLVWRPVIRNLNSHRITQCSEVLSPAGMAWSPDGRFLAVAGKGEPSDDGNPAHAGWVHIFNADSGERHRKLRIGTERVAASAVAWSHDGRTIAAGNGQGLCEIWDVESGHRLVRERVHTSRVNDLAWSLDDRRIASGGINEQVHVWDSETGQQLLAMEPCGARILHIRWSPGGHKLAAVTDDGNIRVWDATRGYEMPDRDFWGNLIKAPRLKVYLAEQQWSEVEGFRKGIIAAQSSDHRDLYHLALLDLSAEDQAGYRKICRRMLSAFAATDGAIEARNTAWVCALRPGSLDEYSPAIALARRATELKSGSSSAAWPTALGAVLFRAGRYEEAALHLQSASEMPSEPSQSRAQIAFLQAMTQQRLGHAADARMWLDRAIRESEAELNDKSNLPTWHQQLILKLFHQEATELIVHAGRE